MRRRLGSITNGLDWNKRVCGKTPGVEAFPFVALPNPFVFAVRVCVSDCAATATDDPAAIVENSTFMVFTYTSRSRACPACCAARVFAASLTASRSEQVLRSDAECQCQHHHQWR